MVTVGLLANLTCIQAELYQMQEAMSRGVNPLWVVPYTTVSADYQELLDDFVTYAQVSRAYLSSKPKHCMVGMLVRQVCVAAVRRGN